MLITRKDRAKPRRSIWYGCDGIGKSSTVAQSEKPVFIDCEDGLMGIEADSTPVCKTFGAVVNAMSWLIENDKGEHRTLVIDSIDWLERMIWRDIEDSHGGTPIKKVDGGFEAGFQLAMAKWKFLLDGLDVFRDKHGMSIVLVAHAALVKVSPPDGESYHRYDLALHKTACAFLREWADEVFFLRQKQVTRSTDDGFGKVRQVAIEGVNERYIQTTETTGAVAKHRIIGLPEQLPMSWKAYRDHWANGNVKGIVKNGTSKKETTK